MQVTEVESAGLKRAYTVVVPAGDIAAQRDKRLAALAKDLRIPGFRPGKVPVAVVKQRYGAAVLSEVLEQSVGDAVRQVISDRGLRPAQQPKVELKGPSAEGAATAAAAAAPAGDLEFRMDLEVMPEVPMPDFAGISLERLKAVPGEEQVDKALAAIAERNRSLEDVPEVRPAAKGDVLICDFTGRRRKAGAEGEGEEAWEAFAGGAATDMPIEVGGGGFIPGFTEQLEGLAPGETREIAVTFPAEYGAPDLAGKEARFTVTAKALKRPVVPAADDALAKAVGLDDLAAMKERIRQQIQGEYDALARMRLKRALLDRLSERAEFAVPEGMVESEFGQIWQRVEADMKARSACSAAAWASTTSSAVCASSSRAWVAAPVARSWRVRSSSCAAWRRCATRAAWRASSAASWSASLGSSTSAMRWPGWTASPSRTARRRSVPPMRVRASASRTLSTVAKTALRSSTMRGARVSRSCCAAAGTAAATAAAARASGRARWERRRIVG